MAHVVSASLGALGPLLLKLTGLLAGEYGRLKGVRRGIRYLKSELTCMHAALEEYTELEEPSGQVKAWISLVRELAYDTEDVFDKFIHQLGNGQDHDAFKEFFCKTVRHLRTLGSRHGIADQIDDLKDRIKHVKELKDGYKFNDAPSSTTAHAAVDPRLHALFADKTHLVGVDGPRDDLSKWMMEESNSSKCCKVLSIVGFGGLGKTTLANEVYRKIQGEFDCRAFVSVSQKPDIKNIVKDVITQVSKQEGSTTDTSAWDEKRSLIKLRELLQDKRYLIVIDDIWEESVWDIIKYAFPENNCYSRIIVTTRKVNVATWCCLGPDNHMHEMKILSKIHSRSLFVNRIFRSEDCFPPVLREVTDEMLKICGGLPLAIICISGVLANKPVDKDAWEEVKKSIGYALGKDQNLEAVNIILSLSYNDLPPNLKTCLLSLSAFPEDYVIERDRLVWRWIAEGFISEDSRLSQKEVAERNFYELINRSIVHPVDIGHDGKVHACRVHDLMLEIIISKSVDDNFITIVAREKNNILNSCGFIRRLSVQYIDQKSASALANKDLSHVRSLTVTASDCIKYLPSLAEFKALRVLDFEGSEGSEKYDMSNIGKLFQLKYISLRNTDTSRLPSQIVMLSDLETLDFRETSVQELPNGFVQLTKLHQLLGGTLTKIPRGIDTMSNLWVISGFNATVSAAGALEELGNLTSLSELSVYLECQSSECRGPDAYMTHEEKLFSSVYKLISANNLQSLHIDGEEGHSLEFLESWSPFASNLRKFRMATSYYFRNIPKWIAPALASLASLDINLTELTEDGLRTVGELPALLHLMLTLETGGYMIAVQGTGFPSLITFEITSHKGTHVTFVKGAMPSLKCFKLVYSPSVGIDCHFYFGFVHLPSLKEAHIWFFGDMPQDAISAFCEEAEAHANKPNYGVGVSRDGFPPPWSRWQGAMISTRSGPRRSATGSQE